MMNQNLRFESASLSSTRSIVRPGLWLAPVVLGVVVSLAAIPGIPAAAQNANPPAQRTDSQVEMDVVHSLDAAQQLKDDWITAGTVQGEVTLSGTSATEENRKLAEQVASQVPGVTKVVNNLKVGNPQTAEDGAGVVSSQMSDPAQAAANDAQPAASPEPQGPMNPPGPPAPRPAYRPANPGPPQYAQQMPAAPVEPEGPKTPVSVAQGTLLKVRTSEPLTSKRAKDGEVVQFTVVRDVYAGPVLAIPRGATITGKVVDVKKAGALGGSAELALKLDTLNLDGTSYPIDSDLFSVKSPNKAGHTVGNAIGGAILGAVIGGAIGGGGGAAIGAGAGAVGGTAASAATPGPQIWIPSEALLDFHLNTAVTVTPVSRAEAQRLAANAMPLQSRRPTLYRRGYYPYGYPPPPPPPGYYAPYPY